MRCRQLFNGTYKVITADGVCDIETIRNGIIKANAFHVVYIPVVAFGIDDILHRLHGWCIQGIDDGISQIDNTSCCTKGILVCPSADGDRFIGKHMSS